MKKLIITGCNGQLGRAMNVLYKDSTEYALINTDVAGENIQPLDITNLEEVLAFVEKEKPYAIVNCAAYTNVNGCETEEDLAFKINAIGPRNLAIAAEKAGAKMVQISTDYVFAGDGSTPYVETDPTGPVSAYGRTKLAGENFVKEVSSHFFILRTAWLYGDGKNFVKTMLNAGRNNDTVRVVCDQVGSPTSASELAKAIDALLSTENYGTFHATCEGVCSWADFTEEFYRLAGLTTKVEHISTDEFPTPAKRPAYSVLENRMFKLTTNFMFKDWKDAIEEYMESGLAEK